MQSVKKITFKKTSLNALTMLRKIWVGRKNGFVFSVQKRHDNTFYVVAKHAKKDIRFNSLWQTIIFSTEQQAFDWCNNFEPENFVCLGDDAPKIN